jgi:hypothetical protein
MKCGCVSPPGGQEPRFLAAGAHRVEEEEDQLLDQQRDDDAVDGAPVNVLCVVAACFLTVPTIQMLLPCLFLLKGQSNKIFDSRFSVNGLSWSQ